jgi:hypothetical protein
MKLHAILMAVVAATSVVGCESDEVPSAATYQECFDDRPDNAAPQDKVVDCCLDFIIGGLRYACGITTADCINYVTASLDQTDIDQPGMRAACEMYADMRPQPME